MLIIPIGIQCTNYQYLVNHGLRKMAYPFDGIISNPKFVYELLELLLDSEISLKELVKDYFLYSNKKTKFIRLEHHYTDESGEGFGICNTKYNVIFPHDTYNDETIEKYIRRFERLSQDILNNNEEICLMYTSQSSLDCGNFTINGEECITDMYIYINKIYNLVKKHRDTFKFIVFDSIKTDDKNILNKNIQLIELNTCDEWGHLIPQMDNYINLFK